MQKFIIGSLLFGVLFSGIGSSIASAYDLQIKNTTSEKMNVMLYTRSDYSWDKFPVAFSNTKPVLPGGIYTFSVPIDSRHACPSYLAGYNENYSKSIVMMGCNGVEADMPTTRCCMNAQFEVYKKPDGSLHFRKM